MFEANVFAKGFNRWKPIAWDNTAMSFGMVVFGAGGGSDESSGDEEEGGSQGSAVDIEDMGRCGRRRPSVCLALPCLFRCMC